ncbi:glyoxalase/bleomycin resistance/dioxygenase family protein [Microbispora sp. H10949]|uniref:glyoxalase/bleomycin resistance/dioxygenase family protein n=1 Tax=Microbispora sp. H10949 TaxID=2729111 RepID=UPI0016016FD4|nr:glyoxalase/bleomycin resistance/dioxygenase family protein [Microbispora sp. H10949]
MPATTARFTLLVLYTDRMEECRTFYSALGIGFTRERHGDGPEHYAAVLPDGQVFELYPATSERRTGAVRLGIGVDGAACEPPLKPGRHVVTDPDGRVIEVYAM